MHILIHLSLNTVTVNLTLQMHWNHMWKITHMDTHRWTEHTRARTHTHTHTYIYIYTIRRIL